MHSRPWHPLPSPPPSRGPQTPALVPPILPRNRPRRKTLMEPKPGSDRASEAWSGAAANAATAVSFPCRCWACIGAAFTDAKRVISGGKPVFAQLFVPAMPRHSALLRLSPNGSSARRTLEPHPSATLAGGFRSRRPSGAAGASPSLSGWRPSNGDAREIERPAACPAPLQPSLMRSSVPVSGIELADTETDNDQVSDR